MIDNNEIIRTIMEAEALLKKMYLESVPKDVKKLILVFFPSSVEITGGLISILSIARDTRKLMESKGYFVQMGYYPNWNFFLKYRRCENDENILNFDDIVDNFPNVEELIMHVPECHSTIFLKNLSLKQRQYLEKIKKLQINIMNQNITLMPEPYDLEYLKEFTSNITQSTAHDKYTTQEVCDKWGYPLYFFQVAFGTKYINKPYSEKQNIICYSKDLHPEKDVILNKIKQNCPEFEVIEINNLSFEQYKELIATAKYCITFGEGFDGYFSEPMAAGSVSFTVYNEEFFPSEEYKKYRNVYLSYQEMFDKICDDIRFLEKNPDEYENINKALNIEFGKVVSVQSHNQNLVKFYNHEPTFMPNKKTKAQTKETYICKQ